MYERHVIGQNGEKEVQEYLRQNNYIILEKNFECKIGEIDIIALDKSLKEPEIVFIEVKTRTNCAYGMPAEAVTYIKQQHIYNTAKYYLHSRNLEDEYARIDVIEVFVLKDNKYKINHIKQII